MFFMARLHSWPLTPRSLSVRSNDWSAKPRQLTYTGSLRAFQPPLLHSSTSSAYLALLRSFASSNLSSQGTVSSTMTTCLVDSDVSTMSGRSEVALMWFENLSCLPRSTWRCQSLALARSPPRERGCCCAFSPALTKDMVCLEGCWLLLLWITAVIVYAKALRIMAPAIPPIPQSLWTAAEDMLQCATPLAQLAGWWVYQVV